VSGISREVRLEQLQADADACGPAARALFNRLIAEGKTHEAAAMYACQQAPGARNTDRAFCQGAQRQMESMTPINRDAIQRIAKRAGIATQGKFYKGSLGRYDDPAAWVSCAQDVVTATKAKRLDIDGVVKCNGVIRDDLPPPPSTPLAPDLVQSLAADYITSDPALAEKCRKSKHARMELRERIIETHGRKKRVKKPNRLVK